MSSGSGKDSDYPSGAAAYIATLTGELASIARRNGLNTLGYLLDMAKLEAEQVSRLNGSQRHQSHQDR